ncbi:MAG: efflux RND transporter permease subunit [Thermoanaerobaculia bacterium]
MNSAPDRSSVEAAASRREAARLEAGRRPLGLAGRLAGAFLESKLTPLLVVGALLLGAFALLVTPREEEPQIRVPMIDVFLAWPGASAQAVEQRLTAPLEKALYEIPGIDHVYSTSQPSGGLIIARFAVGTDPDRAALTVHTKLAERAPLLPSGAAPPIVAPRGIDDVPVLAYTLWSESLDPVALRRVAQELAVELERHPRVAQVEIQGGARRVVRIDFDREKLAGRGLSLLAVAGALSGLDARLPAGSFASGNRETEVEVGALFHSAEEVAGAVVGVDGERPVYLREVAQVVDGPEEPGQYVWISAGAAAAAKGLPASLDRPAVTVAIAKKPGTNAVVLVRELDEALKRLAGPVIPADVHVVKTRDYGATADEKSSELIRHLALATLSVVLLMALALGRREAVVVLVAVPVTLALTLASSYLFGYTLNRVTLFALIFAIGILVDDAIVVVENIHRHYQLGWTSPRHATIYATDEVGNPTILATFAVIVALLPLAFVSGLMGPYMRPIPINASAAMLFSLAVAFVVSPWLTYRLFARRAAKLAEGGHQAPDDETAEESRLARLYRRLFTPLLASRLWQLAVLGGVTLALVASLALFPLRLAVVKMLPHDNKSELQIVVDMPEGTTLEATAAVAREVAATLAPLPEVTDIETYAGTSAPFNFNGLVRHYFLRSGPLVADVQVNLLPRHERGQASHPFAKSLRPLLEPIARRTGANLKVTEVPPGPPVLSTLVAEIYAPSLAERVRLAEQVRQVFEGTPGVVDVDWYVEEPGPHLEVTVDRDKASRAGVSPEAVAGTVTLALRGQDTGLLDDSRSREPVPLKLRLDRRQRSSRADLLALGVPSGSGRLVPLSELVEATDRGREPFVYHKDLRPVTYVVGEVAGAAESPVYALLDMGKALEAIRDGSGQSLAVRFSGLPDDPARPLLRWDGEWQITYEVFRDMGLAFAVVLVLIYLLVVSWFRSFVTPLVIMAPIPFTLIGIAPAHALAGVFFTATSMIGAIALAGIIVRNSILLVDFINLELAAGEPLEEAVVKAAAVRFRPIALTAAALVVGGLVILLDPIFQGLAVALISGVVVATALTLVVIPLLYFLYVRSVGVAKVVAGLAEGTPDERS